MGNEQMGIRPESAAAHQPQQYRVIINAREKVVSTNELSYDQIIALAYNNNPPSGGDIVITITYRNAADHKQGTLTAGQTVEIRNGTIFNVTATNRS